MFIEPKFRATRGNASETMKIRTIFLWIMCVWLWTNPVQAQRLVVTEWGGDFATIAAGDTVDFRKEFGLAMDSLMRTDGIILDLRFLPPEQVWSMAIWQTLQQEMTDYTKPFVLLIAFEPQKEQPLTYWMKERYWSRFEPSGIMGKAEAKLRTLYGRHLKEGQERMDWLMQQQGKGK